MTRCVYIRKSPYGSSPLALVCVGELHKLLTPAFTRGNLGCCVLGSDCLTNTHIEPLGGSQVAKLLGLQNMGRLRIWGVRIPKRWMDYVRRFP